MSSLTLAQLKTYDVGRLKPGTKYARRFPDQKAVDGERIPTLVEVISLLNAKCPDYKHLTYALLEEAHQLGLKVYVWTVDSPSDMVRLMEMGVDGITTNRPDILKSVLIGP